MVTVLGTTLPVFFGLTVVLFGLAAFLTGQALAGAWRPAWFVLPCTTALTAANRFLDYALFGGWLDSLSGYLVDWLVVLGICGLAYRITLAEKMVSQYPWLYRRNGLFAWRTIDRT